MYKSKIGIVGRGVVGSALEFGFQKLGHEVLVHDIRLQTEIEDLSECEIIYICVPTPLKEDKSCDTSIVESVVDEIHRKIRIKDENYNGIYFIYNPIIVIKSTITPGTTDKLVNKYNNQNIYFVPEFLRERCAIADFVELNRILVIGSPNYDCYSDDGAEKIINSHGYFPKTTKIVTCADAEIIKYYHNTLNALHTVISNEVYEICQKHNSDYNNVKDAILVSTEMPNKYMDVSQKIRGYSSICFNKDIPAFTKHSQDLGLDLKLLSSIEPANNQFTKTPFGNTRENY